MIDETAIRARYVAVKDQLDERGHRLFVAAEKVAAGYLGAAAVSRATGVAHSTIIRGTKNLLAAPAATERVRRTLYHGYPCRKRLLDHVRKAQWISMARRLSAGGPPNRSHSDHAGISKKNMLESQITAHGSMNSAIKPMQKTTKNGLVESRNMTFSGAITARIAVSTATPARHLKDRRLCVGGSPAAHRCRR
jgi:hypothetical protein